MRSYMHAGAVLSLLHVSCGSEFAIVPTEPPPPLSYLVECATTECIKTILIDFDDLMSCCDYNPTTGEYENADCPPEINDQCVPPATGDCVIEVGSTELPLRNECRCRSEETFAPCACCTEPTENEANESSEWQGLGVDFLDEFSDPEACPGVSVRYGDPDCPDMPEDDCGELGDECPPGQYVTAPGADLHLEIDPLDSFIFMSAGQHSDQVSIDGNGAMNVNPDGFMVAMAWADDMQLGTWDLEDWAFFFDTPVEIDLEGGEFIVQDGEPICHGQGTADAVDATVAVVLDEDAIGEFDGQNLTWTLDYTQQDGNHTIDVHFEGTFEWVD